MQLCDVILLCLQRNICICTRCASSAVRGIKGSGCLLFSCIRSRSSESLQLLRAGIRCLLQLLLLLLPPPSGYSRC